MARTGRKYQTDRGGKQQQGTKQYAASAPEEEKPFDELLVTKAYTKEQSKAKAVKFGGFGLGLDIDQIDALSIWSSDDELDKASVDLNEPPALAVGRRAARREGSLVGPLSRAGTWSQEASLTADFRTLPPETTELPRGLELVGGGEPRFEKQEDGTVALALPEAGYLKAVIPCTPWLLEEDGRLHSYTIFFAIRVGEPHEDDEDDDRRREQLQPMRLFSGSLPPSQGEKVEYVQIYKNGGVGALGTMGSSEASIKRGRWAWITITRKKGSLRTYVDGSLCADVTLKDPKQVTSSKEGKPGQSVSNPFGGGKKGGGGGAESGEGGQDEGMRRKELLLKEVMCIEPQNLALFARDEAAEGTEEPRSLALKYLHITNECLDLEKIRAKLHGLRARSEAAEMKKEVEAARSQQLSLQALYPRPPPAWLHPAFGAEFGDSFIGGTSLEGSALHVSLDVFLLVLGNLVGRDGVASAHELPHKSKQALNRATALLKDCRSLAFKLAHAISGNGQERLFLQAAIEDVRKLEPGESKLFPATLEAAKETRVNLLVCISRALSTEAGDTCTFTVLSADVAGLNHHRAQARPPKMRFRTALELRRVPMSRVLDGAFWSFLYTTMTLPWKERARKSPLALFYEVLLSFVCNSSLGVAMAASEAERRAELLATGAEVDAQDDAPFRTVRRSNSGHYGVVRHAFEYLLRRDGIGRPEYKEISLLVRLQMLKLAQHDLGFVSSVSAAQRRILTIACRQTAYKAVKLGKLEGSSFTAARLTSLRHHCLLIQMKLEQLNGTRPDETPPPPPLVLCEADRMLLRPSMKALLGEVLLASPVAAAGTTTTSSMPSVPSTGDCGPDGCSMPMAEAAAAAAATAAAAAAAAPLASGGAGGWLSTDAALSGAEVIGLYFSASWCPPCRKTTPELAKVYKRLHAQGKRLQLVFVSSDKDAASFDEYRGHMPFPAMPFEAGLQRARLSELFQVRGIPSLVLMTSKGNVISTEGLELLLRHERRFPWRDTSKPPPETPHHQPLYERLQRPDEVDPGSPYDLPKYKPIDFLSQPQAVTPCAADPEALRSRAFAECVAVLVECDALCTLSMVQSHSVLNTTFLIAALVQHTFTALLPMPLPDGKEAERTCVWRTPMLHAQQLELLLLLQRICEHFAAAAFSLDHTMSFDAVRMVVPAAIACVADVVMRQLATDKPSRVSVHLRGDKQGSAKRPGGFTFGTAALVEQLVTMPVHTAELNCTRTRVLDYFGAQKALAAIWMWERSQGLELETARFIQRIARDLAWPSDAKHTVDYMTDPSALMMKNFPEFRCFRDVVFYCKFFLNPDKLAFPPRTEWVQRSAELRFIFQNGRFFMIAFQQNPQSPPLIAQPLARDGAAPPEHRFPDLGAPSYYTRPVQAHGEDDILHIIDLPDFGEDATASSGRALGQHDAELLLSYLTVPYLRIPLIAAFFATDDRIHALAMLKLQKLLDAALFQPGAHLPLESAGLEPREVPTSAPKLLGTAHHLLLNELCRSPKTLCESVLSLGRQAVDLDTGRFENSTTPIILYVVRLCSRVDNFVSFVLSYERGEHDSIRGKPFRGLELGPGVGAYLDEFRTELHKLLWGELRSILLRWYHKLVRQDADQEDDEVDERARRMCTLHAHLLLSLRNCRPEELTQPLVQTLVCGMIFLSTRHQWNHRQLADEFGSQEGAASYDDWRVPETEVFECLHVVRRKLVQWVRYDGASQLMLDELMDAVVRVSESEGSLMPRADEARMRWAPLNGQVNRGRFQQNGSRTGGGSGAAAEGVELPTVAECATEMQVDVQVMQLTLTGAQPQALDSSTAKDVDVVTVFGLAAIQAVLMERSSLRSIYRLVGRSHTIARWLPCNKLPVQDLFRQYYVDELYPSEKAWLPAILEPVRLRYMNGPQPPPLQIFLQVSSCMRE